MKNTLFTCSLGLAALLAGAAMAGDNPRSDAPHDSMHADTDGDGRVSRAEAAAASAAHEMRGDMKEKMEQRFKEADANSDGQLSLDEAQSKMPRLAERFNTLDVDKNGLLSKEEIRNGAPHHGKGPEPKT